MAFSRRLCEYCSYYAYVDSDYGRLGADHYTCRKNVFKSTRDADWFEKAKGCNLFYTSLKIKRNR